MSRVLVTGSTGFLGSYVTAALLRSGLDVRALVRPGTDEASLPWGSVPALELARADLRRRGGLAESLAGVDTVVHLAAAKSGSFGERFAGTVVATENLLSAMTEVGASKLVLCSTFSVYDYRAVASGDALTEEASLEARPLERDDYAQVKLEQERLCREWAVATGGSLTVLRPGMIYGPGELWNALIGVEVAGSLWIGVGGGRVLPMAWVENVADAFLAAIDNARAIGETLNIVDDELPTVGEYRSAVSSHVDPLPRLVPVPYAAMHAFVLGLGKVNSRLMHGRAKLPQGLLPASFAARFRPLSYPNARARSVLGWSPRVGLAEGLRRAASGHDLVRVVG